MLIFFAEKNVRSFCNAKASLIFSTKNISVFGYKIVKHLTNCPLNELVLANDALNNWALFYNMEKQHNFLFASLEDIVLPDGVY